MSDESAAPTVENPRPSLSMRWLGAVPMFVTFVALVWMALRFHTIKDFCDQLRKIDLPLPTILAFKLCGFIENYYGLLMPGMFAISWLYFGWAAKNQKRLLWFNIVAFLVCVLMILLMASLLLPYLKLIDVLRKK